MPTTEDPPTEFQLAIGTALHQVTVEREDREKIQQQLTVVTSAIEVALGVRELTPEVKARVATLSAAAYAFTTPPTTDEEQEEISKARRALAAVRIEATKQADALKAVLNAPRQTIIDIHKALVATIEKAEKHCQGLENARQQRLLRERQEREEALERENKRIAKEKEDAQRALDEAQRQRESAEEAQRQAESLKGKKKAEAEAEAARLKEQAQIAEETAMEKSLALETAAPAIPIQPLSELPQSKEYSDFELIGFTPAAKAASLLKLAQAHGELFSYHISEDKPRSYSITLRVQDLTDLLNGRTGRPAVTDLPGIKVVTRLTKLR